MILNCLEEKLANFLIWILDKTGLERNPDLEEAQWRQYSIIEPPSSWILRQLLPKLGNDDILVVSPYSCAVVNNDPIKEPYVEVQRFSKLESPKKVHMYGRSPRELHLGFNNPDEVYYRSIIQGKFHIPKACLEFLKPSDVFRLSEENQRILQDWTIKRFTRQSFPTSFQDVAKKTLRKIQDKLEKKYPKEEYLEELRGIYLDIDPFKNIDISQERYDIEVILLVTEYGKEKFKTEFRELFGTVTSALAEIEGLDISNIDADFDEREENSIETEGTVTLEEFDNWHRIDDYDFISLKNSEAAPGYHTR